MALYPEIDNGYWEFGSDGFPIVGGRSENVIEDFEDQSLSEYGGDTADFQIQGTNVIEGRYSLESLATYSAIGDDGSDLSTPRTDDPIEYLGRIYQTDAGDAVLAVCVQSETSPYRDCYMLTVDVDSNELRLFVRDAGSLSYIERQTVSLSTGSVYWPGITLTTEGINGTIYDSDGTALAQTDSYRETTHSGGGLGWRNGAGTTAYFDQATYRAGSMGDVSTVMIDDYEDGDLNEYDGPSSSGDQATTPSAAYAGNYGIELTDFGSIFSRPGMGLDNYPRDGIAFEAYLNPQVIGNEQYWVYLCPQHSTSTDDTYMLQCIMDDDVMRLQKDVNGSHATISGSGTGNSSVAYTGQIDWQAGNWYRIEVLLDSANSVRVDLYDASSGNHLVYVEGTDTEYVAAENGFGFYSSGGGNVFFDEIQEV